MLDYDGYVSLMRKKTEAIDKMKQITLGQRALIDSDDIEGLAFSMELRQNCIDNIDKLDAQMQNVTLSSAQQSAVAHLVAAVREAIREIELIDILNRPAAEEKLESFRKALRDVSVQQKAIKAYQMSDGENSIYFDEKK